MPKIAAQLLGLGISLAQLKTEYHSLFLCYTQLNPSHLKWNLHLTFLLTTLSFPGVQTLVQGRLAGAHTHWFHRAVSLCLGCVPSPGQVGLVLSPLHRDICKVCPWLCQTSTLSASQEWAGYLRIRTLVSINPRPISPRHQILLGTSSDTHFRKPFVRVLRQKCSGALNFLPPWFGCLRKERWSLGILMERNIPLLALPLLPSWGLVPGSESSSVQDSPSFHGATAFSCPETKVCPAPNISFKIP